MMDGNGATVIPPLKQGCEPPSKEVKPQLEAGPPPHDSRGHIHTKNSLLKSPTRSLSDPEHSAIS